MTPANPTRPLARRPRLVPLAAAALAVALAAYAALPASAPRAAAADADKPHDLLQPGNTPGGSYGEVAKGAPTPVHFKKITLSREFTCEGAAVGDFNHDGHNDVVAGPYWYEGPDFSVDKRHEIYTPKTFKPDNDYSDNFITYSYDFKGDGWADILVIGFPGAEAFWYENPRGQKTDEKGHWKKHLAYNNVDDESPGFWDILGNGKPCIVSASHGHWGYAQPDPKNPDHPWKWHNISPDLGLQRFTHGIGVGDVNGDGKPDLLERNGWWEQPASLEGDPEWKFHPVKFFDNGNGDGTAQMYTYDVNGDGKPDVITSLQAHGYGLAWFEQKADGSFEKHLITGSKAEDSPFGVHFGQLHAVTLADINGDGVLDIVTGKRHFAHGSHGDVEPLAPSVLYWFELVRKDGKAEFVPHLIDDDSGVGTQVTVGDLGPAHKPGIVVGNKNGTFVFIQDGGAK